MSRSARTTISASGRTGWWTKPRTRRRRSPRARKRIFERRRLAGEQITLAELANELGVSRERVRQLEVRAFEKVQKAVKNRVALLEGSASLPVQI